MTDVLQTLSQPVFCPTSHDLTTEEQKDAPAAPRDSRPHCATPKPKRNPSYIQLIRDSLRHPQPRTPAHNEPPAHARCQLRNSESRS